MKLAVVIPVYNEELTIRRVIVEWTTFLAERSIHFKMYVVNDGSTDNTPRILDDLAKQNPQIEILHQSNQGHGGALLQGYRIALKQKADWIFQVDGDRELLPDDFLPLWEARLKSPLVLGLRTDRNTSRLRRLVTQGASVVVRLLTGHSIEDPNVPFRLIHSDLLAMALQNIERNVATPNIFITIYCLRREGSVAVLPVSPHPTRRSSLNLLRLARVGLRSLMDLYHFYYRVST